MNRRNAAINASLLIGTIIVFFFVIEIALRLTGFVSMRPRPPQIYERNANPEIGYSLKPNVRETAYRSTVTVNGMGLRGPEIDVKKPVMAVLGDSITFGYGVEDDETLPARLQKKLPDWSVANVGVPGYTLGQESELFKERLAGLDTKFLILVFYFNDLDDQRPPVLDRQGVLREPGYIDTGTPVCVPITEGILRYVPSQCWLNRHSALFVGIRKYLSAKQEQRNLEEQKVEYRENFQDDVSQQKLDAYGTVLKRFSDSLGDMPRLFVIWPEKHMHYIIRPRLKILAEENGFKVLDLYDTFGNDPQSLSWDTVHPAPETIARAAEVIALALEYFDLPSLFHSR